MSLNKDHESSIVQSIIPLTEEALVALARDPESDLVERKESATSGDTKSKILEAICAFSNDLPGYKRPGVIFVGLKDNGVPVGKPITDEQFLSLGAMRSDGKILPLPVMSVQKILVDEAEVAAITVYPSDSTPVRYDGRVWIRVGPRRAIASAEEERRLREKRRTNDLPFDQQACVGSTLDDIDLKLFRDEYLPSAVAPDILEQNHRTLEEQLSSLRLLTREGTPTNACILLLGKKPRDFFPGSYIQFLRIQGKEYTDPILDQKTIEGNIKDIANTIDNIIKINIKIGLYIPETGRDIPSPDYPTQALQQLIYNALLHRSYDGTAAPIRLTWYEDRVELMSPGGLFGQVTPELFGQPGVTDYRNPTLAEGMRVYGFVQRFGWGIPKAMKELERNMNPPLDLRALANVIIAVIYSATKT